MEASLSEFQFSERRAFARKRCQIPLSGLGLIRDISLGGICLEGEGIPESQEIPLTFTVGPNQIIIADARVVNSRNGSQSKTFGLKFTHINVDSRLHILNYLSDRQQQIPLEEEIRNSLETFIHTWTSQFSRVSPEFKKEVADFRLYLNQLKQTLSQEERKLAVLVPSEKEKICQSLIDYYEKELQQKVHGMLLTINEVIKDFTQNEHTIHRTYFREQLMEFTQDSVFFKRAFEKPLGYAGDYMMMEMLYHGLRQGETLWHKVINSCLTSLPMGNGVRNRAWYLSKKILDTLESRQNQNIMSLACGPCTEVAIVLEKAPPKANYYLVDQDKEALKHAQDKLARVRFKTKAKATLDFRSDSVKRFLKDPQAILAEYPKMDFIYTAGLYDYLDAAVASKLTKVLFSLLKSGGQLVIGNFERNEYSYFIEYASDWFLIYRTPEEMLKLVSEDMSVQSKKVEKESLDGVSLFLCLQKI